MGRLYAATTVTCSHSHPGINRLAVVVPCGDGGGGGLDTDRVREDRSHDYDETMTLENIYYLMRSLLLIFLSWRLFLALFSLLLPL